MANFKELHYYVSVKTLDLKTIGNRIETARKSRGLTQAELGDLMGDMSQSNINKLENRAASLTLKNLFRLSEVLNYPVSYFLGLENTALEPEEEELLAAYRELPRIGPFRRFAYHSVRGAAEALREIERAREAQDE